MLNLMRYPLFALLLVSAAAWADEERYDPTYSSIRLTSVDTDFDNLDRAFNLGFTLGINIPGVSVIPSNMFAAEIDLSSTLIPGENRGTGGLGGGGGGGGDGCAITDVGCQLGGGGDGGGGGGGSSANNTTDPDDLRLNSVGIFLRARTPGTFFGMARAGYRFVETTISELNEEQTGSTWGLGLGYRYSSQGAVELTYTQYGSDINYLSLSVSY